MAIKDKDQAGVGVRGLVVDVNGQHGTLAAPVYAPSTDFATFITSLGTSTKYHLIIGSQVTISADLTTPANILLEPLQVNGGAFNIASGKTLTVGKMQAGRYNLVAGAGSLSFSTGAVSAVFPQWKGAVNDGITDDSDALIWSLSFATTTSGVYRNPVADWGSYTYLFTKRLMVFQRLQCNQSKLIASGSGAQFKMATNAFPASPNGPVNAGVDCCIFVMDGGSIDGLTMSADSTLDVVGNAGIWLLAVQESYGFEPSKRVRIDGNSASSYLNGMTVRFCTTGTFSNVGCNYVSNGFRAYQGNLNTYRELYFQKIRNATGNKPFEFNGVGDFKAENLWHEQGGAAMICFTFDSCGRGRMENLVVGNPTIAGDAGINAVRLISCSDLKFRHLNVFGNTFSAAKAYSLGSSDATNLFDSTYNAKADSYGKFGVIPDTTVIQGRIALPYGLDLADTNDPIFIARVLYGATISFTVTSRSGAITAPAIDIYYLVGGAYSNRGTLTFANFVSAGDGKTLTFNVDTTAAYYFKPSAGTGIVDVEWAYNLGNGNVFI